MVAVTGANGLVGNFMVRELAKGPGQVIAVMRSSAPAGIFSDLGDKVIRREADVLDVPALIAALEGSSTVIHTAATVSFNPRKARKIMEVNCGGTRNVVDVCLQLGVQQLIHISSIAALGRSRTEAPVDENAKWIDNDLNSDYAHSKYLAELEAFRGMEEGLAVAMVNPSVILAPADWTKSSAQIFRYIYREKMFYTEGSLNYVDVRDVVAIVMKLLTENHNGQKFIANAGTVSFLPFFKLIASRFGKKAPSVSIARPWTGIVGWLEEARSLFTGSDPLITRQTARLASEKFTYSNEKAKQELGIVFRTLEESLDWCCTEYLRKINTNK